jgi:hypothetical protein
MSLPTSILQEFDDPSLSINERAQLRCRVARHQEWAGDFEAAREALGELWQGVGLRPNVEGLDEESRAVVLMRAGALTGWIGSASQIEGSQETAKDLISESIRIFEELGKRRLSDVKPNSKEAPRIWKPDPTDSIWASAVTSAGRELKLSLMMQVTIVDLLRMTFSRSVVRNASHQGHYAAKHVQRFPLKQ